MIAYVFKLNDDDDNSKLLMMLASDFFNERWAKYGIHRQRNRYILLACCH